MRLLENITSLWSVGYCKLSYWWQHSDWRYGVVNEPSTKVQRHEEPPSTWEQVQHFVGGPTHIVDRIYLGNAYTAAHLSCLKELKISSVINVSKEIPCYWEKEAGFDYLQIPVEDDSQASLSSYWPSVMSFIERVEREKPLENILIHCLLGRSRSASLVVHYLMHRHAKPFQEALDTVVRLRPIVRLNQNFVRELSQSSLQSFPLFPSSPPSLLPSSSSSSGVLSFVRQFSQHPFSQVEEQKKKEPLL